MLEKHFWKLLALLVVILAPAVLFVMTNHEDAAGAYGSFMFIAFFLLGCWKVIDDL